MMSCSYSFVFVLRSALLSKMNEYTYSIVVCESEEVMTGEMSGGLENHVNRFDVKTVKLIVELQSNRAHYIPKSNSFTWLSQALARSLMSQFKHVLPLHKPQK